MRAIHYRAVSALCLVLLVVWVATPDVPAAGGKLPDTDGWIEARTENFRIYSNASARLTRKTAVELQRFRQALGRITTGLTLDTQVPTSILLFRNDATYRPYKVDAGGRPRNVSGYFQAGPFKNIITLDASAGSDPLRVLYHEYFHAVMNATLGDLPAWLSEGLAEYYSTFRSRGGTAAVEVGHPIEEHLEFLGQHGMISWDDLFSVSVDSPTYNEGRRQGSFYAQSWLLVHYLGATDEMARGLSRYLTLLRNGDDPEAALEEALGMSRRQLGSRAESYAGKGSGYVWWDLPGELEEVPVSFRDMRASEVLFRLGDLLARAGPAAAARTHLHAAAAAGWPPAAVNTSLGVAALGRHDLVAAADLFTQAIAAGAAPVEAYYFLADIRMQEVTGNPEAALSSGRPPAPLVAAIDLLQRGLQQDGDNFHALVRLAQARLLEGNADAGLAALDRARALRPLDLEMLHLGACLLGRSGSVPEAWTVIERSIRPQDPTLADEAGNCVAEGVVMTARELTASGDREAAVSILTTAMEIIEDAAIVADLATVHDLIAQGGTIIVTSGESAEVDDYNHAMRLANEGKHDEALAQLGRLLEDCTMADLCTAAAAAAATLQDLVVANEQTGSYNEAVRLANAGKRKQAATLLRRLDGEVKDPELQRQIAALLQALGAPPTGKR